MASRLTLRIIAPALGASFALLLVGGLAAWYLHRLQQDSSQLLVASITRLRAAEELEMISYDLRNQLYRFLFLPESVNLTRVAALRQDADRWLNQAREKAETRREQELLGLVARGYEHLFSEWERVTQDPQTERHREQTLNLIRRETAEQILQPAQEYRELNRALTEEASRRNQALADRMGLGLLLLGMCGAVAGLTVGYGIARGIQRSIVELSVPIRDAGGVLSEVVGPLAVSSDASFQELEAALQTMTEQVGTVVQRLQESQHAAWRAEHLAALGQLAAGLAHELRNPLTAIKLLLEPESEGVGPPLDTRDLSVLRHEVERLEQTLQTFLDYARPPRLEKRPVVIRDVLEQTASFVASRARQLGIDIVCECHDSTAQVAADPGQLRQVLLNLLLNALDASPSGSQVTLRLTRPAPHRLTLEVADRGLGLPAALGARIFEPFVTTKESGTGLGLPICRQIIERHGGQLSARNREGGGALFEIDLPLRPEASRLAEAAGAQPVRAAHSNRFPDSAGDRTDG